MKIELLLIAFVIFSCTEKNNNISDDEICYNDILIMEYENENLGMRLNVPQDYFIDTTQKELFFAAVKVTNRLNYIEGVGASVLYNTQNLTLREYFANQLKVEEGEYDSSSVTTNFHRFNIKAVIRNEIQFKVSSYQYSEAGIEFVRSNYYFSKNRHLFMLFFLSNEEFYDSLQCKFNAIINTVNLQ